MNLVSSCSNVDIIINYVTVSHQSGGNCAIPLTLQGVEVPIITDAACTDIHGVSFQSDNMICVGGEGAGGSCSVSFISFLCILNHYIIS